MRTKKVDVPADVAAVLDGAEVQGSCVVLPPGQLERKLYEAVNKVLCAMGGKWNRKAGGHVFPFDPTGLLADAIGEGKALDRWQTLQFFQTPVTLAGRMASLAGIADGDLVLEPSAGHGRLLAPLLEMGAGVIAVEVDPVNEQVLRDTFNEPDRLCVERADFLEWARGQDLRFDAVVMNPPFSGGQDVAHIRAAWELLANGGRLVALCSESAFGNGGKEAVRFRGWLAEVGAGVEPIPAGTFKESGTGVSVRLVTARRGVAGGVA